MLGIFIEIPESKSISVGETAEFRCRHTTADIIVWRVNGSLISFFNPPPDIATEIISGDSKLTIVGRPEYNGIEVVGVARFFSSASDESTNPPAILGGIYPIKHSSYILYMQKFYCTNYYIVLQFR